MATKKHKGPFIPRTSGERVSHARRLLGVYEGQDIDATEIAARVGVTVNAVYAWEAGTLPGAANLKRLAEVLRVPREWIHYGVTEPVAVLPALATAPTTQVPADPQAKDRPGDAANERS